MTIRNRILPIFLAAAVLLTLLSGPVLTTASAGEVRALNPNADEVVALISDTYKQIKSLSGRRSFYNHCSTMVNYTTVALGLQTDVYSCNGSGEYNLYQGIAQTDRGYNVNLYSAKNYSLAGALNAISDNGTKDVYNIIIGWQSGSSYAARYYGHTCYIFAILDGYVYFYESYGLSIGGRYYREGAPIVCTIAEFARYYDRWARFEGAVHFATPQQEMLHSDFEAPRVIGLRATNVSAKGFDLNFGVTDNVAMRRVQIRLWTQGQSQEEAIVLEPRATESDSPIRINTADFGGFIGNYFVSFTALDQAGNEKSHILRISLYPHAPASGTYRVLSAGAEVRNAPYKTVNGVDTLDYTLEPASMVVITGQFTNELGETWYLLGDDTWIRSESVVRELQWYEVLDYANNLLQGEPTV